MRIFLSGRRQTDPKYSTIDIKLHELHKVCVCVAFPDLSVLFLSPSLSLSLVAHCIIGEKLNLDFIC